MNQISILPDVSLYCNGVHFTRRQLEALRLIADGSSLRGAAALMGISAPTLFNYIGRLEEKCGLSLLDRGKGRSTLTPWAREIVERYRCWVSAVMPVDGIVVACTPLSEDFVREALEMVGAAQSNVYADRCREDVAHCREDAPKCCEDDFHSHDDISMIVGDDRTNLELGLRSIASVVIFDDPLFTYDLAEENPDAFDVGFDRLLLCDRGPEFARFPWGAQRLGFRWLESSGREFSVRGRFLSADALMKSGKSFFMERSLVKKYDLSQGMFRNPKELVHAIVGVRFQQEETIDIICENVIFAAKKSGFR